MRCSVSTDHMKGTVRYLAPEIMKIKECSSDVGFDSKVDVWALGITLLEMLLQQRIQSALGKEQHRAWLEDELVRRCKGEYNMLRYLHQRMLAWDSHQRISAADISQALGSQVCDTPSAKRQQH